MADTPSTGGATRRDFVRAAAAVTAATFAGGVHAAGSDTIRVGLVGCGGRGTGAAGQALKADPKAKLVAMGDVFADAIDHPLNHLKGDKELATQVDVPKERQFVGFDAYKQVIDASDVVLLCTPPGFRPQHLAAAVAAGKHCFVEKPVAVDPPGLRKVMAACEEAKAKNLNVVSGLCWRYESVVRESMKRVLGGEVGDVVSVHSTYYTILPGKPWPMVRKAAWSDMEWQVRNWYWWTWLSGDHIVEQAVHSIDKGAWAMHDGPCVAAVGVGGLASRKGPEPGNIFDHHAVTFDYANGVKHFHFTHQANNCYSKVFTHIHGTGGTCQVESGTITDRSGKVVWKYKGPKNNMYQQEHDELFAAIRAGTSRNDGPFMNNSTLMALLGRMATYTGQVVKWEQALNSKEDLSPPHYEWGPLPIPTVAVPGKTKVV
jgi:myo-inositol 2-dehydrogenase / D-chiro-inositol 1-dehydrogenase